MRDKKITIYDVAKKANVSLATVSRVINNKGVVKEKTKLKVEKAIDELDYVPNAVAQGLASKRSENIALIVPEASFSYISKIINGVVDKLYKKGYNLILYSTNFGEYEMDKIVKRAISTRIDGAIILSTELTSKAIDLFYKYNIPVSIVGTSIKGPLRTSVYINYENICYQLVSKYLDQGKEHIYFVDGDYNRFIINDMLTGIKKAYKEHGKIFKGHLKVSDSFQASYDELKQHLQDHKVDLYLGARDSLAIAALNAALDLGYSIPEDLEIIGYNNTKYSRMSRPTLSTIDVPLYEIGQQAAESLIKMIDGGDISDVDDELYSKLIVRETSKVQV
jgi:LacI family transcriptional regulator